MTGQVIVVLAGLGALFVLFGLRAFHERGLAVDDAYILTRYASQFADGHGFRWNVTSPPVEGFTSPLFVVLLAGLLRLGVEPTAAAALLNIAAIAGVVALMISAAGPRRPGFSIVTAPAAFLLLHPGIGIHASRGLETSVFFFVAMGLVALTGAIVRRPGPRLGLGMAALSLVLVLTRPDGAIVVAVCWAFAGLAIQVGRGSINVLFPGAATLSIAGAAFALWKAWYFGDLLPTAYYAKASGVGWAGVQDVRAFVADSGIWLLAAAAACAGGVAIATGRVPRGWRHMHVETIVPVVVAGLWLLYSSRIVHEMGFAHRFSFVLVPLAGFGVVHGLRAAIDFVEDREWLTPRTFVVLGWVATVGVTMASVGPVSRTFDALRSAAPQDPDVVVFTRLGQAIARAGLGEQISYMDGAAGAAPYFARARHVDPGGLATREFSKSVSFERRRQIFLDSKFDIIEVPFLPASPGADDELSEPLRFTDYWKTLERMGQFQQQFRGMPGGMEEWFRTSHWMMRYLRDNMTLVGRAQTPGGHLMFVYVARASPHSQRLIETLSRELAVLTDPVR